MEVKEELKKLLGSFASLSDDIQIKEIENKIKKLIGILNEVNIDKELLLIPSREKEEGGVRLTHTFLLLCCLEDEIAKLLDTNISNT